MLFIYLSLDVPEKFRTKGTLMITSQIVNKFTITFTLSLS
jgi:hypothetical protein